MTLLAKPEPPPDPVAHHGVVSVAPSGLGQPFTATVPSFDELLVFEIRRWAARGGTIPAVGDEVLVVIDDVSEPWVPVWWPAAGDVAVPSAAMTKGFVEHAEDPSTPRPGGFASVEWNGIVPPVNAIDTDTWVNPGRP